MGRLETFPVDMPARWTTWRYRVMARVRVAVLGFVRGVQDRLHALLVGRGPGLPVRLGG